MRVQPREVFLVVESSSTALLAIVLMNILGFPANSPPGSWDDVVLGVLVQVRRREVETQLIHEGPEHLPELGKVEALLCGDLA